MSQTQICINWESYLNNVSKGFTSLQKNAEFVDMTLAAEGHLVKVHRNLVAIASPYLRAMLQSTPCQHPVIFLNNISQKVLSYILEYIYTGEVRIPPDLTDKFIEACKALCIGGVEGITAPTITPELDLECQGERIDKPADNNFAARILINGNDHDNNYDLEVMPNKQNVIAHNNENPNNSVLLDIVEPISEVEDYAIHNYQPVCENEVDIDGIDQFVILKSKTACSNANNIEQTQGKSSSTINKIEILSDEVIIAKNLESICDLNSDKRETWNNECEINFSNSGWQIHPIEKPSTEELSANMVSNVPNVVLMNDCTSKPNLSHSKIQDNSILSRSKSDRGGSEKGGGNKNKLTKKLRRLALISKEVNRTENRPKLTLNKLQRIEMDKTAHYSISSRGSLQLILNRYLYNSHHHAKEGRKRRWRCVDYRKMHCPAYIDTHNDDITAIEVDHCHSNHDIQIRKKISNSLVFTSQSNAVNTLGKYLKEEGS